MGFSEMQNGEDKVTNEKNWIRHISRNSRFETRNCFPNKLVAEVTVAIH